MGKVKEKKHLKHQMKSKRRIHQVVIGRMKNNNNKKKGFLFFCGRVNCNGLGKFVRRETWNFDPSSSSSLLPAPGM